ncbi:MAG: hypothetical protein ACEPOV_03210 [Hyphomicrobiales bacterium]
MPSKFNISNPKDKINSLTNHLQERYKLGSGSDKIAEVKNLRPIFAFDYLSLSKTNVCFNSKVINQKKDYLKLLEGLKKISSKTFDDLTRDKNYHFHSVDFSNVKVKVSENDFLKCLVSDSRKIDDSIKPTVYQFKIFEEARILGFLYRGIFYLVWFDRQHEVYKRK